MSLKPPERSWDWKTDMYGGLYVWFEEMMYIDARSITREMEIDQATNKLKKKGQEPCKLCSECKEQRLCRRLALPECVQQARDEWWYRIFESKFIGEEDVKE